jgi:hypothetical protein
MGFRAPHDDRLSILPDEFTCNVLGSYSAVDLLDVLEEPCYASLLDEVEFEIDHGSAAGSVEAFIDRVFAQMQPTSAWPAELLELSETDTGDTGLSYTLGVSGRGSFVTESERAANAFDLSIDYHNPSSVWADSLLVGGASPDIQYEGSIDYHNPSSPWADSLLVGGARSGTEYEGFIDYHNPSSPWADSLLVGGAGSMQ